MAGRVGKQEKNGNLYWEEVHISPMFARTGKIRNYVSFKEDITERKCKEEELVTARQQAEIANVAKSAFLANMSHELRTPLNAIIGFSESMALQIMGPLENKKYLDYSRIIHESGAHLRTLINDILDLAKVEAGKDELNEENVIIKGLILESVSMINGLATKNGVAIERHKVSDFNRLYADKQKMKQVLLNLLSNAIKFTPAGGTVSVRTYLADDGSGVITVSDTGIGISKQDFEKVFTKFEQIKNDMTGSLKGTGLGLALSRRLMEMHGGKLELESVPGSGTTVSMIIPEERILPQKAPTASLAV